MKTVSPFEYAIMKAVNQTDPSKVTTEDLSRVRRLTDEEVKRNREADLRKQASRLRIKN